MKRLILSLVAAAAIAGPVAAIAQSWDRGDRRGGERHEEYRGGERHDEYRGGGYRGPERREDYRGPERRDWDDHRNNGYYYNNRWYYGPPPSAYYRDPYYRPGYLAWRRGGVLPPYYRGYVVGDYYRYHLRPPPRGYAWYRVGDDYLLAAITTGLIFDIIAH